MCCIYAIRGLEAPRYGYGQIYNTLIKKNLYFFVPFFIALIIGAFLLLSNEKGTFVLHFAAERKPLIDSIFMYITQLGEEMVYAVLAVAFLFVRFRYSLLIGLLGVLNLVISAALKALFAMPRPGFVYWMDKYCGDIHYIPDFYVGVSQTSSFPSGHTLSAFALYCFTSLIIKQKGWGFLFFTIALLVGISRIVLTQHFLMDVYAGSICGVLVAMSVYALQKRVALSPTRFLDKNLLNFRKANHP